MAVNNGSKGSGSKTGSSSNIRYYILFENYEQGMELHGLLDSEDIENRIAPAPRETNGKAACGMALLIKPEHIEAVRSCIEKHDAAFVDIVALENQLISKRDRYC